MSDEPEVQLLRDSQISQLDNFINFKIIILGDSGVGKSSLLKRAVQNSFNETYQATVGFEFLLLHFKVNELKIKFQIWDTCGQETYRSLVQGFYHNSSLAILVYDISQKNSFDNLQTWLKDLKQHTEEELPIFVAGNKNDLEKNVETQEVNDFSKTNNIIYTTECSAKTGYKVKEIFFEAAKYLYQIYKKMKNDNNTPLANKLKIDKTDKNNNTPKKKLKCCNK